jgi:hypothetical protein
MSDVGTLLRQTLGAASITWRFSVHGDVVATDAEQRLTGMQGARLSGVSSVLRERVPSPSDGRIRQCHDGRVCRCDRRWVRGATDTGWRVYRVWRDAGRTGPRLSVRQMHACERQMCLTQWARTR